MSEFPKGLALQAFLGRKSKKTPCKICGENAQNLKDVAITPAALAWPGGDRGEDTTCEKIIENNVLQRILISIGWVEQNVLDMVFLCGLCPGATQS